MGDASFQDDELINHPSPFVSYFTPLQSPAAGTFLSMCSPTQRQPLLFTPLTIRGLTFQNRIWVSPMCQYSADDGNLTDWHLVQLGTYATRGASLVIVEATSVSPEGRNGTEDTGLWRNDQIPSHKRVVDFIHSQGQKAGIQLQHAGRKASTTTPWIGAQATYGSNGWPDEVIGPSAVAFNVKYVTPKEMTIEQIQSMVASFAESARRAVEAGYDIIELHGAHGYLLHEFLSPKSNKRADIYGGSFENRIRFSLEVVRAVRSVIPGSMPLFFRLSVTDWLEPGLGWEEAESIALTKILVTEGVDLMDCTTGGLDPTQKIPVAPAFQAPFAKRLRDEVPKMLVAAVGMIYDADLCRKVVHGEEERTVEKRGMADAVLIGREFLRNPNFVLDVAKELGVRVKWPIQLHRAEPRY